jgi:class 3 adenylate cyclase
VTADIKYVRTSDGVDIAYQVIGDGPMDLVVVPQIVSHLEYEWEHPSCRDFYTRLGSFARVIRFDKRGAGQSDRIGDVAPTIDNRLEDVRSVMGAVGSEQAALMGISEGGTIAAIFAATYPARTKALIMSSSVVSFRAKEGMEGLGFPSDVFETMVQTIREWWGTGTMVTVMNGSAADDPRAREWWARFERLAGTPGSLEAAFRMNIDLDVTSVIPLIQAPTLLVYRSDELWIEHGRYFAKAMPEARLVELPGQDHLPWVGDYVPVAEAIEEFLTGRHAAPRTDRALATVLFTDVAGSTDKGAQLGDRRWRSVLDSLDDHTANAVRTWDGRVVKSTGDGHLATFVGPTSAIRCAEAINGAVRSLGVEVRSGLHSGEIEFRGADVSGIAVNIANRVAELASPREILVSRTVTDLVAGSGLEFDERGEHELKGVPGRWQLYAVRS